MKFSDHLNPEQKKLLEKKYKRRRRRKNKREQVVQTAKCDLPMPLELSAEEREYMEFERMMRGQSWRRGRGGAIRQTRHSE
jgi:hypothetical protein